MPKNVDSSSIVNTKVEPLCKSIGHPEIVDTAESILDEVYDEKLYGGRSTEVLVSSVVFATCRVNEVPVSSSEIADVQGVDELDVINTYKYLSSNIEHLSSLPVEWKEFLDDFSKNLKIRDSIYELALEIGENGVEAGLLSGRQPRGYAASCLYAATKRVSFTTGITQESLANESGVSKSTIRTLYQKLLQEYNNER